MANAQRLELRQSQRLAMTPQLRQAIHLLQLTNVELRDFVERQMEENPLLTHDLPAGEIFPPAPGRPRGRGAPPGGEGRVGTRAQSEQSEPVEGPQGAATALREHLLEQARLDIADPLMREIAGEVIGNLDARGYLGESEAETARRLGCAPEAVSQTLEALRGFDPPGVFARDLADCLALQLRAQGRMDALWERILAHLDLLAQRDFEGLAKRAETDPATLAERLQRLRGLTPDPAAAFEGPLGETPAPDLIVRARPEGGWRVEINAETLPRVMLDRDYHALLIAGAKGAETRAYLAERRQQANWLLRALDQRQRNLLAVASEILRRQEGFLEEGVAGLKPLTLKAVGEAVDLHESTVSRVVNAKTIETPRGLYGLRFFFTGALKARHGSEDHAAAAVKERIRAMIAGESADAVLSDARIAERLKADGIAIARRTVAKYRSAMRIGGGAERRRARAMEAHLGSRR